MQLRINPFLLVLLLLVLGGGVFMLVKINKGKKAEATIESSLIIERIEKVMKLVSVEGHYSEMFSYDKSTFDFPGFRKKAMVQVTGKVLVGYDMKNFKMNYDVDNKVLNIEQMPKPELLAIDANTRYFDMEQGFFNSFTKEELSLIDQKSKEIIRQKALSDGLVNAAEEQKNEMLLMVVEPLLLSGWKVNIEGKPAFENSIQIVKQ